MTPKFRATLLDRNHDHGSASEYGFKLYDSDVEKYHVWMDNFKESDHLFVTVEKITKRKLRSVQQNSYYWGVVIEMLTMEIYGANDKDSKQEMHDALRRKFLSFENVKGLPTMLSTTRLSTIEFEAYMEQIRRFASQYLGIVIPEPNQVDWS